MATITRIKSPSGAISYRAQVRRAKFKSAAKTFTVETASKAAEKVARQDALDWAAALEKELDDQSKHGGARRDITQLTIGGLIAEYQADPNVKALKTFESDIVPLTDWFVNKFGAEKIRDFGELALLDARRRLLTPSRSHSTVNRYLSAMRGAWNWGRGPHKLINKNNTWPDGLMLPEPKGRTRFLSDDEITALLKAAESDPVLRAAIVTSIVTGLRQGELLALKWSDIDLTRGEVIVRESKNDTQRGVHLAPIAVEALKSLKVTSLTHPFVNAHGKPLKKSWLEVRWRKIRTAAGLQDFKWHDLRHTCASVLAQEGATLLQIGSVLGHKSPIMTQRYSHLVEGKALPAHAAFDVKLRPKTTQK